MVTVKTKRDYSIRITTVTKMFAGPNGEVEIQIFGTHNETEPSFLDNAWHDDFERGKTDSFKIKSIELGEALDLSSWKFWDQLIPTERVKISRNFAFIDKCSQKRAYAVESEIVLLHNTDNYYQLYITQELYIDGVDRKCLILYILCMTETSIDTCIWL